MGAFEDMMNILNAKVAERDARTRAEQAAQLAANAPRVVWDPKPTLGHSIDGVSIGSSGTTECDNCSLRITPGVSASSIRMFREYGNVTLKDCALFSEDVEKVNKNEMAFQEFKRNLGNGKYLIPV